MQNSSKLDDITNKLDDAVARIESTENRINYIDDRLTALEGMKNNNNLNGGGESFSILTARQCFWEFEDRQIRKKFIIFGVPEHESMSNVPNNRNTEYCVQTV